VAASGGNRRSGIRDYPIPHAADRSPGIPVEIRADISALCATGLASEERLEIGKPDVIRPSIAADRCVVAAAKIGAVDQETANASGAHFPEADFVRAGDGGHGTMKTRPPRFGNQRGPKRQ
jgi:hypothetical protein